MIRRLIAITALGVASLTAIPAAHAANPASLACIRQQAGEGVITGYVERMTAALLVNSPTALTPDWTLLRAPAARCKAANKWSPRATELAALVTIASIMRDATLRTLQREGADVALIQRLYRGLPVDARRSFLDNASMPQGVAAFEPVLRRNGIDPNGKFGRHIGMLAGALSLLEFRPAEFTGA